MSSGGASFIQNFDRIYVEEEAYAYGLTADIISRFPQSAVTAVKHYKDFFNRAGQSYELQKNSRKLILAVNHGQLIYRGSPVCQNYEGGDFFYTSTVLNCPFDCDYCFLKGRYATANIVIFVNTQDYLNQAAKLNKCYLSVSFDTDLPALEPITGACSMWAGFAADHPETHVEIRTKTGGGSFKPVSNLIYAFTLSPDAVIREYEHGTAGLDTRIRGINRAVESGCTVRICIDPILYVDNWRSLYGELIERIISEVDVSRIRDFGIGAFRISADYIKAIRRCAPQSDAVQFPFEKREGYCVYPADISKTMVNYVRDRLREVKDDDRIFCQY